ncbi:MAG: Rieske 2Fe-2S domain-containing protein [Methylotenera sp.]|nr:Rieske 2Fe-2S domain-containing protein [Methylotenera sp.]
MQIDNETVVFASGDLQDEGKGLRFPLPKLGNFATGFVIRFHGKPYAYVNQCAHIPVELDWNEGDFFTSENDYLICSTHGAHYQPQTGYCVRGPCKGKHLKPIGVTEQDQKIIIHIASIK